jgi:hypothetical protein
MWSDLAVGLMLFGALGGMFAALGFLAEYLAGRDYRKRMGGK